MKVFQEMKRLEYVTVVFGIPTAPLQTKGFQMSHVLLVFLLCLHLYLSLFPQEQLPPVARSQVDPADFNELGSVTTAAGSELAPVQERRAVGRVSSSKPVTDGRFTKKPSCNLQKT